MKVKTFSILFLRFICVVLFLIPNYNMVFGQEDDAMQDAKLEFSFDEGADSKKIIATATDMNGNPIEELDLYFYVKRTFSNLPFGDVFNTTDENGTVQVVFPNDLPGDHEGNVTILVKIIDSDLYNDQTVEFIKKWGVPSPMDQLKEKRSLWAAAANAPIPLVLIISSLIVTIWFIICYIIYILIKISKIRALTE